MPMIMQIWIRYVKLLNSFLKKKPTLSEQDIDMKAKIQHRIQESYQYTDALKDQLITYDDTKWIKSILSSTCLSSAACTIHDYLTTIQTHEKFSSHTHPHNWKECQAQSLTLFHHS